MNGNDKRKSFYRFFFFDQLKNIFKLTNNFVSRQTRKNRKNFFQKYILRQNK
jgi:hypothetical protein